MKREAGRRARLSRSDLLTAAAVGSLLAALSIGGAGQATAQSFAYPDFSNTSGLTFVGSAGTASTSDGTTLRLTPNQTGQSGAAYSTTPTTLGANATFSTAFRFRLSDPGGISPADGFTFVLSAASNGLGASGGGLGYEGVQNSVAIEFDTFNNGSGDNNSDNQVSVNVNGSVSSQIGAIAPYGVTLCGFAGGAGCLSNGDIWSVLIGYNGSQLNIQVQDGVLPPVNLISVPLDITAVLGTNEAFVGFTASTGSGYENHDILNWSFANTTILGPPVAVPGPVPGTGFIPLLGLAGAWYARRRKQRGA